MNIFFFLCGKKNLTKDNGRVELTEFQKGRFHLVWQVLVCSAFLHSYQMTTSR